MGVIVTAEGHVAISHAAGVMKSFADRSTVYFSLADGRRAEGLIVGLVEERDIAFAQITEGGVWPFVPIADDSVEPGQLCAALDYPRFPYAYEDAPSLSLGSVTRVETPFCLRTSCPVGPSSALFSLDGRFLGILTTRYVGRDGIYTPAACFKEHWALLTQGLSEPHHSQPSELERPEETDPKDKGLGVVDAAQWPEAIQNAARASVRIMEEGEDGKTSGTIISADGYVATCGHRSFTPGKQVTVLLPDGRNLAARVVGVNHVANVGLLKITGEADLPFVVVGDSTSLDVNGVFWLAGYPANREERQPLVRKTRLKSEGLPWKYIITTSDAVETMGGDSGGGLFDSAGGLLAVHQGGGRGVNRDTRIELLQKEWELLESAPAPRNSVSSQFEDLRQALLAELNLDANSLVVEVLRGTTPCAVGTIVGDGGRIVTKASEVYGDVSVRFADGTTLSATIERSSRVHDLALLSVRSKSAGGALADADAPLVGQVVAALLQGQPARLGIISHQTRAIPNQRRAAGLPGLAASEAGLTVVDAEELQSFEVPLAKGDVIRAIEGTATPDLETFHALTGYADREGALGILSGDPVAMTIARDGKSMEIAFRWPPDVRLYNESTRWSGFPAVFDTDVILEPKLCGGPLVDRAGRIVGVTIACRGDLPGQTHVLPAAVVRDFLDADAAGH